MIVGQVVERKPSTEKKAPAHYVDNKKFYEALVEHRRGIDEAKVKGVEPPRVSEYIGECFLKIATHLSYKANFINYTYKDDMISDGIENCLTAVAKFDPARGTNPFAYYTQITFFAFVRRIQKEKKQQATKYKLLENVDIDLNILGLGPDGHVASLFPGIADVDDLRTIFAITDSPKPPAARVSFTMSMINSADEVWIVAAGESKAEAVTKIIDGDLAIPASYVRGNSHTRLIVDTEAFFSE